MTLNQLTATRASGAVVLIRLYVGLIFAGEGILKFVRPDALGPGRFIKAGIPAGNFFAYLDGVFEIGCGLLILAGLVLGARSSPDRGVTQQSDDETVSAVLTSEGL